MGIAWSGLIPLHRPYKGNILDTSGTGTPFDCLMCRIGLLVVGMLYGETPKDLDVTISLRNHGMTTI